MPPAVVPDIPLSTAALRAGRLPAGQTSSILFMTTSVQNNPGMAQPLAA